MIKKTLLIIFAGTLILAACSAFYNAGPNFLQSLTGQSNSAVGLGRGSGQGGGHGQGQGQGQGRGQGRGQGSGYEQGQVQGSGPANQSQTAQHEILTLNGVVSTPAATSFTLKSEDSQTTLVQLGNSYFVESIGLKLNEGDRVTVKGFLGEQADFSAASITVQSTGKTYTLRDPSGRPLWAGNGQGGGQGSGQSGGQGGV